MKRILLLSLQKVEIIPLGNSIFQPEKYSKYENAGIFIIDKIKNFVYLVAPETDRSLKFE
jgi:hypothetical protein